MTALATQKTPRQLSIEEAKVVYGNDYRLFPKYP